MHSLIFFHLKIMCGVCERVSVCQWRLLVDSPGKGSMDLGRAPAGTAPDSMHPNSPRAGLRWSQNPQEGHAAHTLAIKLC